MAASQPMIAQQVLAAYSFRQPSLPARYRRRRRRLSRGGRGTRRRSCAACCSICRRSPTRPASGFRTEGLSSRAVAIGGSFLTDQLPEGADIVSLVRVIHDHDDDAVMTLLRAVRRALPAGGTLLIAEPISGVRGAEPIGDAYFAFYLLAMGSGRPRTFERLTRDAAGGRLHRRRAAAGRHAAADQRAVTPRRR